MNAADIPSLIGALWWAGSMSVLVTSALAALMHPSRRRPGPPRQVLPPLTAAAPIQRFDPGFEADLASLFAQSYPDLEIIVAVAEPESAALAAVRRVQLAYPSIASRIVRSDVSSAASPKLNTMWAAMEGARHDVILTKDSNIRLDPGDLERLVRQLTPDTGLVSTISIATAPRTLAAWVEASIINCFHARLLMLADAAEFGFGCGKIMLFRRSDLGRAGGLRKLAWALGEDAALAKAMSGLGLRTVLAERVSRQVIGARSWHEVWNRHLRWMLIWRMQVPVVFFGEFFVAAMPTAAAAAVAAHLAGAEPAAAAAGTLGAWFLLETLVCLGKGWGLSVWSPVAFLVREMLVLALWLRACTTDEVYWGGAMRKACRKDDGRSFAPVIPARNGK